ncbi:MAG: hypothetical protein E7476_03835 [Ruminococcaceae bacterium]|jgi:hypothetical protein|nr:hypothetical protein [Oscillospiraceae bacterium]
MNKKMFSAIFALLMVLSLNAAQVFAVGENEASTQNTESPAELNGNIYNYDQLVTNDGWPWTAISKTITKNYNLPDVPAAVYYTEYIDSKWYSGELKRTGEIKKLSDNIWQATYTGKINY